MSIVSAIVILLLAISSGVAAEQNVQVFINTTLVALPPPIVSGLMVMMPLHDVLAYFDGGASWDPRTGIITVGIMLRGATAPVYVELHPGQAVAKTKDRQIPLESPPRFVDGWIYVPLAFFQDALGAVVDWDQFTRSIYILSPLPPPPFGMPAHPPRSFGFRVLVVRVDTHRRPERILVVDQRGVLHAHALLPRLRLGPDLPPRVRVTRTAVNLQQTVEIPLSAVLPGHQAVLNVHTGGSYPERGSVDRIEVRVAETIGVIGAISTEQITLSDGRQFLLGPRVWFVSAGRLVSSEAVSPGMEVVLRLHPDLEWVVEVEVRR